MRSTKRTRLLGWIAASLAVTTGCAKIHRFHFKEQASPSYYKPAATEIEYPGVRSCLVPEVVSTPAPLAMENPADITTREIRLDEVITLALQNSEILRSLGGAIVQAPAGVVTNFDPRSRKRIRWAVSKLPCRSSTRRSHRSCSGNRTIVRTTSP